MKRSIVCIALVVGMAAAAFSWAPEASAQGVDVGFLPAHQSVAPGSEFDLTIQVTRAGSRFNGFDAIVGYDPAALTLVPLSPLSSQQGSYMTGACSNTFHRFRQGSDRDSATVVLLCNGASVPGPGPIYQMRFRASSTPQLTTVHFLPGLAFYYDGLYVTPVSSSAATIGIGVATDVEGVAAPTGLRVRAAPNPIVSGTLLAIETDRRGPQDLFITDLSGRTVRRLQRGDFEAGRRTVSWNGRGDSGVLLPAGVYLVTLRAGDLTTRTRVTLLH